MRIVHISIQSIRVTSFSPRYYSAEVAVRFNDGKEKEFHKSLQPSDSGQHAKEILQDISSIQKSASTKYDGERFEQEKVKVVIKDIADTTRQLTAFFSELKSRIDKVKQTKVAEGYLQAVKSVNSLRAVI
ncbi:hypothetical protein KY320_04020 [Candidatus Woesearchaeota archaeon]|nr:hypothetical protein [Candidatus Woesearchaeota archaeon]